MRKPLIGILPLVDMDKESYWMLPGYMKGITQASGIPVMLPLISDEADLQQLVDTCDGFLFTGGQDVSPSVYHEQISEKCGDCCQERDEMEITLFRLALERDKAVLGICRGIQFMNAALGGSLYQDLPTEHPSNICHQQKPPYDESVHEVRLVWESPLCRLLGKKKLAVNSYHHQAINALSPDLEPMAYSEDGLVEAVWCPTARYVWAVQWHPEFSYHNDDSRQIFESFVDASLYL